MATESQIREVSRQGWAYYAEQSATYLSELKKECVNCKGNFCILGPISALAYQVESNLFNGTTDILYDKVLKIMGNYYQPTPGTPTIYYGFFNEDVSADLEELNFQFSSAFNPTVTSLNLDLTAAAEQKYLVVKTPVLAQPYLHWGNVSPNEGDIPDFAWDKQTIGGNDYYYTRNPFGISPDNTVITLTK